MEEERKQKDMDVTEEADPEVGDELLTKPKFPPVKASKANVSSQIENCSYKIFQISILLSLYCCGVIFPILYMYMYFSYILKFVRWTDQKFEECDVLTTV